VYHDILERARQRGYELAGLVRTEHTGTTP